MKRIRVVVAGIGGRGEWAVAETARNGQFELVGLVDRIPERIGLIVKKLGLSPLQSFQDVNECIAKLDFDAFVICTPDGTHAELSVPALRAGKFVFVEKPLEITANGLNAIIEADRLAGGRTFVGFNLRYAPVYVKMRELIDSGVVGKVLTIQADEFYDGGRTYFRRWNRLRKFGGGLWITKACHDFDLLYWMAGADPISIYADSSLDYYTPRKDVPLYCSECALQESCSDAYNRYIKPGSFHELIAGTTGERPDLCLFNSDKDTFDHGIATVTFANNIIATYTVNVVAGFMNRRMRIAGTRATLDGDLEESKIIIRRRDPSSTEEICLGGSISGHGGADEQILTAFAHFVRGERCSYVSPAEAAVAVRMGLAARLSSDSREVIHLHD